MSEPSQSSGPQQLEPEAADRACWVGVDLGGTTVRAALVGTDGAVLDERCFATEAGRGVEDVVSRIVEGVEALHSNVQRSPKAVAVGCPGLLERTRRVIRCLPNFQPGWVDVPLAQQLEQRLGIPTYLLNDARLAALGELCFGYGRAKRDPTFLLATLGTGVGGGVVVDGRLRLGKDSAAGEIGHVPVASSGRRCGCGALNCLESVASGPALAEEALRVARSGESPPLASILRSEGSGAVDSKAIGLAGAAGDRCALAIVDRYARYLAQGFTSAVVLLQPDAILLSGGISGLGPLLVDRLREYLQQQVRIVPIDDLEIRVSALGERAGVLGAAAWARGAGDPENASFELSASEPSR